MIKELLNVEKTERLGASEDWQEILAHSCFKDVNQDDYISKKVEVPFLPKFDEKPIEDFFNVKKDEENMNDTQIGSYSKAAVAKAQDQFE